MDNATLLWSFKLKYLCTGITEDKSFDEGSIGSIEMLKKDCEADLSFPLCIYFGHISEGGQVEHSLYWYLNSGSSSLSSHLQCFSSKVPVSWLMCCRRWNLSGRGVGDEIAHSSERTVRRWSGCILLRVLMKRSCKWLCSASLLSLTLALFCSFVTEKRQIAFPILHLHSLQSEPPVLLFFQESLNCKIILKFAHIWLTSSAVSMSKTHFTLSTHITDKTVKWSHYDHHWKAPNTSSLLTSIDHREPSAAVETDCFVTGAFFVNRKIEHFLLIPAKPFCPFKHTLHECEISLH